MRFEHVSSALDAPAPRGTLTGSTRWLATDHDTEITLHWAWARVSGLIIVVNPVHVATNVVLVDAQGRPEPLLRARAHLLECIEALPWREIVRQLIDSHAK